MREYIFYVYILTNEHNNVLYTGLTNNLERRCFEHRTGKVKGFTKNYNVHKLVYYERYDLVTEAISREKQIKGLIRSRKINLIESFNQNWMDLYKEGRIISSFTRDLE